MNGFPSGLARKQFSDGESLATKGNPIGDESTVDGWRRWSTNRSKVAGMIERGIPVDLTPESRVLYLGASSGTTVSHIADIVDVVYAVEFAPGPMRQLIDVAEGREAVIPLLKDARRPETYGHIVEANIDVLIQDVATRDQAGVALANRRFLSETGTLLLAVKARSEDVTAEPATVFDRVRESIQTEYRITESTRLDPEHVDHLAIRAKPT